MQGDNPGRKIEICDPLQACVFHHLFLLGEAPPMGVVRGKVAEACVRRLEGF